MRVLEDLTINSILLSDDPNATTFDKSIGNVFARRRSERPVELVKVLLVSRDLHYPVATESDIGWRQRLDSDRHERLDREVVHRHDSLVVLLSRRIIGAFPTVVCVSSSSLFDLSSWTIAFIAC